MGALFTALMGAAARKKPYKRQLAYLEGTGTQYIELGHGFAVSDEIDMEYMFPASISNDKYPAAPRVWNNDRNRFAMPGCNVAKVVCGFGAAGTNTTILTPSTSFADVIGTFYRATYQNRTFTFGELTCDVSAITWGSTTQNLRLFYGYNTATSVRIKYYKHTSTSQGFSYDLIPVMDWNDFPCMYDQASGVFFYNAGTGTFNYGEL